MADGVVGFLSYPARARRLGKALRQRALTMLDPAELDEHERQEYSKLLTRFDKR